MNLDMVIVSTSDLTKKQNLRLRFVADDGHTGSVSVNLEEGDSPDIVSLKLNRLIDQINRDMKP